MQGYSVRNLKYMAKSAEAYPENEFVRQAVAQIPWGHNVALLDKVSSQSDRLSKANLDECGLVFHMAEKKAPDLLMMSGAQRVEKVRFLRSSTRHAPSV